MTLDERVANMVRKGVVASVQATPYRVKVTFSDGAGEATTGWLQPVGIFAGASSEWRPLSVGQDVVILSPSGVIEEGLVLPGGYNNANPQPSNDLTANIVKNPSGTTSYSGGKVVHQYRDTEINSDIKTTGALKNNGKDVGSTHQHSGISSGPANTGAPV